MRAVGCCLVFKQKTAYEMRISGWSSDVCSSDLERTAVHFLRQGVEFRKVPFASGQAQTHARIFQVSRELNKLFWRADRKSVVLGTSVSVRVDLGGRRIIKQQKR